MPSSDDEIPVATESERWPRIILHADMDAFYAAVEQLDHPELRGQPLLIGHPGRRGVVTTASYEARPFGVGSAMPMAVARRLCPQAIVVPPRMERYVDVSKCIMQVFARFSPIVEPLSLDEAFLDMTGCQGLFGTPVQMGRALKDAVFEATGGLTVSVGAAVSKYVAKVASDVQKPDGLTLVDARETLDFLHPLPVSRLWGVGKRGQEVMERLRLCTIGDVARADEGWLKRELGVSLGAHVKRLSMGQDPRAVVPDQDSRSIGSETTLAEDVSGAAGIRPHLLSAADIIARRLRADALVARGLRVKLKNSVFAIRTRQMHLEHATDSAEDLIAAAEMLLDRFDLDDDYRLVGLAAFDLAAGGTGQSELFEAPDRERQSRLDRALDSIADRFGSSALRRGSRMKE